MARWQSDIKLREEYKDPTLSIYFRERGKSEGYKVDQKKNISAFLDEFKA